MTDSTAPLDPLGPAALAAVAETLVERAGFAPRVHLVLGSGLGALADAVEDPVELPFPEIPGFPPPTVQGHAGRFLLGRLAGVPALVQSGRYHFYEGHPEAVVCAPIRLGREAGAEILIVTNAAGGIRDDLVPGRIMLLTDHINHQGRNALTGPVVGEETRFTDLTVAYDVQLRARAHAAAAEVGAELREGVYLAVHGPTFETPAEIRMFGRLGADAVGMSTVPEVSVARAGGTRCLGFSLITNHAAGKTGEALNHEEVMEVGRSAGRTLGKVIERIIAGLGAEGDGGPRGSHVGEDTGNGRLADGPGAE